MPRPLKEGKSQAENLYDIYENYLKIKNFVQ